LSAVSGNVCLVGAPGLAGAGGSVAWRSEGCRGVGGGRNRFRRVRVAEEQHGLIRPRSGERPTDPARVSNGRDNRPTRRSAPTHKTIRRRSPAFARVAFANLAEGRRFGLARERNPAIRSLARPRRSCRARPPPTATLMTEHVDVERRHAGGDTGDHAAAFAAHEPPRALRGAALQEESVHVDRAPNCGLPLLGRTPSAPGSPGPRALGYSPIRCQSVRAIDHREFHRHSFVRRTTAGSSRAGRLLATREGLPQRPSSAGFPRAHLAAVSAHSSTALRVCSCGDEQRRYGRAFDTIATVAFAAVAGPAPPRAPIGPWPGDVIVWPSGAAMVAGVALDAPARRLARAARVGRFPIASPRSRRRVAARRHAARWH